MYCQVGKANQGKLALNVAVKTLELYKEYVLSSLSLSVHLLFTTVFQFEADGCKSELIF